MNNIENINNSYLCQLLEFEVAFSNEIPLTPKEYMKGGSREVILKAAAFFLSFKEKNTDNRTFLSKFFCTENEKLANEIYDKIVEIENKGQKVSIINTYTSLMLFELFFSKEEEQETQTNAEFERNLFKAYLLLNSQWTKKQQCNVQKSTQKLEEPFKYSMWLFCGNFPINDKINYDIGKIWVSQIIKAIYLFQFLEINEKTKCLLRDFLDYFKKDIWQEFLKSLISATMAVVGNNEKETFTDIVVRNEITFDNDCDFLEKFIIQDDDDFNSNDFLTLRAKPFYKIDKGTYRIIFDLFVVEKIFKGLYFIFRDINKKLPETLQIKEFKSFFGKEFSEKILAYKVIESIYSEKCIKFSGQELDNRKIDGAPDYYIRKGKNIFLFESKDFLISADKKSSFDYEIYNKEFEKFLYYERLPNGKEKPKAVMQLINNIEKILTSKFDADKDYKYEEINIYPILLTHDCQYDVFGFNYLLNYWFMYELDQLKQSKLFIHKVRPLTVINIDSLINNQAGLIEKITLSDLIDKYHKYININIKPISKENFLDKHKSFANFVEDYFKLIDYKEMPPILNVVGKALFNQNNKQ